MFKWFWTIFSLGAPVYYNPFWNHWWFQNHLIGSSDILTKCFWFQITPASKLNVVLNPIIFPVLHVQWDCIINQSVSGSSFPQTGYIKILVLIIINFTIIFGEYETRLEEVLLFTLQRRKISWNSMVAIMKVCKKSESQGHLKNVARPSRKISQGHLEKSKNKLMKCELIFRLINLEAWPRTLIPAICY